MRRAARSDVSSPDVGPLLDRVERAQRSEEPNVRRLSWLSAGVRVGWDHVVVPGFGHGTVTLAVSQIGWDLCQMLFASVQLVGRTRHATESSDHRRTRVAMRANADATDAPIM